MGATRARKSERPCFDTPANQGAEWIAEVSREPASCTWHRRRRSVRSLALKKTSLMVILFLIVLLCTLLAPQQQQVEGAKKIKKAAKSIAKGLILSKLTSRKNFLPVPLPIPGKWQQVAHLLADSSGVLAAIAARGSGNSGATQTSGSSRKYLAGSGEPSAPFTSSSSSNSKKSAIKLTNSLLFSGGQGSAGKKLLLFGASNLVDTLANADSATGGKVSTWSKMLVRPGLPASTASSLDGNHAKRLTRLAAAKYAERIISNEANNRPVKSGAASAASSLTSKKAKSYVERANPSYNQRNDALVTAFNVVKLAQQIREIDPQKILSLYKKSSIRPANYNRVPIFSMNINNRKTFMNKMHYVARLTSDLHHRHRNKSLIAAAAT